VRSYLLLLTIGFALDGSLECSYLEGLRTVALQLGLVAL